MKDKQSNAKARAEARELKKIEDENKQLKTDVADLKQLVRVLARNSKQQDKSIRSLKSNIQNMDQQIRHLKARKQ